MLFKLLVLCLLGLGVSLQVTLLMRCCREEEPEQEQPHADSPENPEAKLAERKFSEGVLNVLNYENPMERGRSE